MGWGLRIAGGVVLGLGLAVGGLVVRGQVDPWTRPERPVPVPPDVSVEALADLLSTYIRIDTQQPPGPESFAEVTRPLPPDPEQDAEPDAEPATWTGPAWKHFVLSTWAWPLGLETRDVGEGLALFVPGDDPEDRPPVLWLSHVDVVAVDETDLDDWTHPPLGGVVADGYVWGRGALDNKASTVLQLEALRQLMEAGGAPSRDLVLLITPDEEVSGATAEHAAAHLEDLGGPTVVIDEGSYVLPDFLDGMDVAAVAVAEKTYVSYALSVQGPGGHSSMPRGETANDVLVSALARLAAWDTPSALPEALVEGLTRVAGHRAPPESWALANADLLEPVLRSVVQATPAGDAVTRDTVAITVLDAGVKDNVIPSHARAVVNTRLRPGVAVDDFTAQLMDVLDDDRVRVEVQAWPTQAGLGRWDTATFRALEVALPAVVPGAVVIPSLTPGTTDSRYFAAAGLETYRIHPFVLDAGERARLHGLDERLALPELGRGVRFYWTLAQLL